MSTVHIKHAPRGAVRVDRATRWGNPFVLGKDGSRSEVIEKHRQWLWREVREGRISLESLASLDSKDLACWCAPQACHADTLARAARWAAGLRAMVLEPNEVELHEWDCGGTVLSVEDGGPDGVLSCDTCEWEVVLDS